MTLEPTHRICACGAVCAPNPVMASASAQLSMIIGRDGPRIIVWLLVGMVIIAAIIGLLFITRGTAVQRVRGVGRDGTPVSPAESTFPLTVAVLTGTTLMSGNRVELALNGDGTFPRLWADLRSAQKSITIQMYYAEPGRVADMLATILTDRAKAGVLVFMLYDAFGSNFSDGYVGLLRAAGVTVVAFRPFRLRNLWVVQNRAHIRGIIIDGRIAWTGGFGIDDKWLGSGLHPDEWRDTNVRFWKWTWPRFAVAPGSSMSPSGRRIRLHEYCDVREATCRWSARGGDPARRYCGGMALSDGDNCFTTFAGGFVPYMSAMITGYVTAVFPVASSGSITSCGRCSESGNS